MSSSLPYGKISSSFLLHPSFFLSLFQLPLSSIAKMDTVFQVNLVGSGFYFVTHTLWVDFAARIDRAAPRTTHLGNHVLWFSELFVHLKNNSLSYTKDSNICP